MRMLFCGEIGLGMENEDQTDETLDGLLQVASNRCPVRTLLTQVTFFKLIIAFSSFFFQLLISLIISECPYDKDLYSTHKLEKFLPRFQKLQHLLIARLDIEDSCLKVLGAFCKNLR